MRRRWRRTLTSSLECCCPVSSPGTAEFYGRRCFVAFRCGALFIIVLGLVCSHFLCGGSWTSSEREEFLRKKYCALLKEKGTNVWTRVMNSVWICMSVDMCVCVHACDVACES